MRHPLVCAGIIAALSAAVAHAAPPAKNHPLLGTWTYTMPDGKCSETYLFRPDGTLLITSGEQVAESKFEVSPAPTNKGFYKLHNTITKDNGKKDCSGETMSVGQQATVYLHLEQADDMMGVCEAESLSGCFGPLLRKIDQSV
jgi:hypothetical protein